VGAALFSAERVAFADAGGTSPTRQIVLVRDWAGWPTGYDVHVPEHVHLLFLPSHSPAVPPCEHLWPLSDTPLVNRHFRDLDELEEVQFARCAVLQIQRDRIRSATLFPWWPQRIRKRQGPRRTKCDPLLSSWDRGEKNSAVATGDVPKRPAGLRRPLKGIGSKLVA
jgi:hypothetical protein